MRKHSEKENTLRERKCHRRQRNLQKKLICFCMFAFLLGVLCGKLVFAKDKQEGIMPENKVDIRLTEPEKEKTVNINQGQEAENANEEAWNLVLVNSTHAMEEGYVPQLAEIENNYYFDARAVEYLQQMLADGRKEGLDFWICSAYRTMEKQTSLYENKIQRLMAEGLSYDKASKEAATVVAYPGTSEHQLGLAVDIVAKDYQQLDEKQANTKEAKWLEENCWKYGFILRYPLDKTEETGIIFEPWHYRYVGVEAAKEIMEQGICLEEYLGILP